jgi:single-strand DNA-binding protein
MSVNKVILIGNVGKDPEIRYLDNNVAVANFTLATTERGFTSREGQQVPDRTEWHNIVAWRGLAQVIEKYVKKGTPLYIEGKIRTRSYDDKDGNKRYITEIFVDNLQMLGKKNDGQSPAANAPMVQSYAQNTSNAPATPFSGNVPDRDDFLGSTDETDDLPF